MRPKHTARDQKSKTAPANAEGGNRKAALNRSRQKFAGTTDFINGIGHELPIAPYRWHVRC
jgi:hypothetical protein